MIPHPVNLPKYEMRHIYRAGMICCLMVFDFRELLAGFYGGCYSIIVCEFDLRWQQFHTEEHLPPYLLFPGRYDGKSQNIGTNR